MKRLICILFVLVLLLSGCQKEVENKKITIEINGEKVQGEFTGVLNNKLPSGQGKFKVTDEEKWEYLGNFFEGKINGEGKYKNYPYEIQFQDEMIVGVYSGETQDGLPSGKGRFECSSENVKFVYEGEWSEGEIKGEGKLKYNKFVAQNDVSYWIGEFDGEVINGVAQGYGKYTSTNNDNEEWTYQGDWKDGIFDGQGVVRFTDDKYYVEKGTFVKGEFKPTKAEYMISRGYNEDLKFGLNEKAEKFITKYNKLFPCKKIENIKKYIDTSISYRKLVKSPGKYGNKLIRISDYYVGQIWENEQWDYTETIIIAHDGYWGDVYYIFYLGELKNIYEGDYITCYGLPIDSSCYENIEGGITNCYVVFGSYISK